MEGEMATGRGGVVAVGEFRPGGGAGDKDRLLPLIGDHHLLGGAHFQALADQGNLRRDGGDFIGGDQAQVAGGAIENMVAFVVHDAVPEFLAGVGLEGDHPMGGFIIEAVSDGEFAPGTAVGVGVRDGDFGEAANGGDVGVGGLEGGAHGLDIAGVRVAFGADAIPDPVVRFAFRSQGDFADGQDHVLEVLADHRGVLAGRAADDHPAGDDAALRFGSLVEKFPARGQEQAAHAQGAELEKIAPGEIGLAVEQGELGNHQGITCTTVPTAAKLYSQAASSVRRLTQPWLIGTPKLLCQ